MKKKIFILFTTILCLLLIMAVQLPYKTAITTEALYSIQNNGEDYPEELNIAISKGLFDQMSYPVFADSVYIIQEEYLIKQDKTMYFVPYIMANIEDVGTAGTSTWGFWLNTLMVEEDGTTVINANEKYNKSASTLIVEADPNTVISESSYDRTLDNVVSITLDKNKWAAMDEHAFQLGASTLDSSQSHNVDAIVSFRWESALSFRIGKAVPFVIEASSEYVSNYNGIEERVTLEQALQEYAMQVVPGDGFYFGWKQLAEEESGEKGTAYGVLLFHSVSGSPLIFSEETGYYCSAIYSTYLLPISVFYEKTTNGSYVITACWTPSEENYEQDILSHFPPETADLVFENLDQYTTEILKEIAEHDAEKVQVFFPGGPVWPAYSFNEELDNTELCGLAGYYPVGDIYYEPVHNELIHRFKDDPVALLDGLSQCNEETQNKVRNFIVAEVGASELEAGLLALKSEDEVQVPAEQVEKGPIKPAEPPAEGEVPIKIFEPADVEFSGQTLTAYLDTITYQERLVWIETETEYTGGMNPISSGEYLEGQGCIAYIELWPGRGYFDENLVIRFADGTQASLLLPRENGYADALPDSMKFQDGKFIYEITFPTEELTDEGQSLIHLKGIYHYEVDLPAKTLSLTIIQ